MTFIIWINKEIYGAEALAQPGGAARVFAPRPPFIGSTAHSFGNNLATYKELYLLPTQKFSSAY